MCDLRLLIVDDDRGNCAVVSKLLSDQGYQVDVATDGPSALALVDDRPYALALLDFQMPGMNGVELYRQISQRRPEVLGVFLTAFTTLDTIYPAISAGVKRVLAKPVNRDELISLVSELVGKPSKPAMSVGAP